MPIHYSWDNPAKWDMGGGWAWRYFFGFHVLASRPDEHARIHAMRERASLWLDLQWYRAHES